MRRLLFFFSFLISCGAVSPGETPAPKLPDKKEPLSKPATKAASASAPTTSAASLPTEPPKGALPLGVVVRLVSFGSDDPLSKDASAYVGLLCVPSVEGLFLGEGQRAHGVALCGVKRFPTALTDATVSVVIERKSTPEASLEGCFSGESFAANRSFRVQLIDPSDAYFKDAARWVGVSCVAKGALTQHGEHWFSGAALCGPALTYVFFSKVALIAL